MIIDRGEKHNKTKANFHEPKKAKTKAERPMKKSIKIFPNLLPIPTSIYSICACIFVANSKMFAESNQACSCDKITERYFFLKLYIHLLLSKPKNP